MSASIPPILERAPFNARTRAAIGRAFDTIVEILRARGETHFVQDAIAQRVTEVVKTGETNPDRISQRVLRIIDLHHRRLKQVEEGEVAMREYRAQEEAQRCNMIRLRMQRLSTTQGQHQADENNLTIRRPR